MIKSTSPNFESQQVGGKLVGYLQSMENLLLESPRQIHSVVWVGDLSPGLAHSNLQLWPLRQYLYDSLSFCCNPKLVTKKEWVAGVLYLWMQSKNKTLAWIVLFGRLSNFLEKKQYVRDLKPFEENWKEVKIVWSNKQHCKQGDLFFIVNSI